MIISEIKYNQAIERLRFDADFYKPKYIETDKIIRLHYCKPLPELAKQIVCGPFGSTIHEEDYRSNGVPLLRVADLKDFFVASDNLTFVDELFSNNLIHYQVLPQDLVVSQRGTIAMFSMVTNDYDKWIISANLIAIKKSEKINFYYLLVFLNSKYGITQLKRRITGQVQPKITTDDVKEILVPIPPQPFQQKVESLVKESYEKRKEADRKYKEAEELLNKILGIEKLAVKEEKTYEVKFSEVEDRLDSEYYKPQYMEILRSLKPNANYNVLAINEIKEGIRYGTSEDLDYVESGVPFLRLVELNEMFSFDLNEIKYVRESDAHKLKPFIVKEGDLLVSRTGTVGCAVYIDKILSNSVFGSYFIRVRLKQGYNPLYVSFFLNSIYGRMQSERKKTGAVQTNLTIPAILSLKIVLPHGERQDTICKKYLETISLHKEAKELLEKAKKEVVGFIENNSR